MTLEKQMASLELAVEEFARVVASLHEELFLEKLNGWSARDIVAHLVGWNRYVIEGSWQITRGEIPFYDMDPGENYSRVNAVLIRDYSSRDRQELLGELRAAARELRQFLRSLGPGKWDRDYGVRHQGSTVTIKNTVDELIEDYVHHREQIKEWAKRLAAG